MAKDKRRKETRIYTRPDGETKEYEVYFIEGRDSAAIEESEMMQLAVWAGCKDFVLPKPMQTVEDNMFWSDKQISKARRDGVTLPDKGVRYIAYCYCIGPDGNLYEDSANGAADNIDMRPMRTYAPELATKRARVRCAILALGLKGLNADSEFPDQDRPEATPEAVKENVAALDGFLDNLKMAFKTAKIPTTEREKFLEKMGLNKPINQFTDEEKAALLEAIAAYKSEEDVEELENGD